MMSHFMMKMFFYSSTSEQMSVPLNQYLPPPIDASGGDGGRGNGDLCFWPP
jgi:hypothetical protein